MKALDVCFKTHFVFDLSYQEKCSGVWEFIESVVFELKGSVKAALFESSGLTVHLMIHLHKMFANTYQNHKRCDSCDSLDLWTNLTV